MEYGKIKFVDKPISRLVYGTAAPAMFQAMRSLHGNEEGFGDQLENAFTLLDEMFALGVNAFDCSNHYGEEPVGDWMDARGLRDKCVILTKGAHHNMWRKRVTDFDILSDAHDSLEKLKTNYIDIYVLHRDNPDVPVGPLVEVLNRLHDEGKIGAFGASNWTMERIADANEYALKHDLVPFTVSSPNFGLADQVADLWGGGCVTISGPSKRMEREWYADNHIPVFAYSTMARGFFSGKLHSDTPKMAEQLMDEPGRIGYCCDANFERLRRCEILAREKKLSVSQIAMAWIFNQQPLDVYAITACSKATHMKSNIEAAQLKLTPQECAWLDLEGER